MNAKEWRRVAPEIRAIVERHTSVVPVRLGSLAEDLGVTVKVATLRPGVSGEIRPQKDDPHRFVIRVNRHESRERQRFTLAHELAHFLLHKDLIGDGITDDILYRSCLSNRVEAEANRIAADLVMPRHPILNAKSKHGFRLTDDAVQKIAGDFQVSVPAMKIRLGIE